MDEERPGLGRQLQQPNDENSEAAKEHLLDSTPSDQDRRCVKELNLLKAENAKLRRDIDEMMSGFKQELHNLRRELDEKFMKKLQEKSTTSQVSNPGTISQKLNQNTSLTAPGKSDFDSTLVQVTRNVLHIAVSDISYISPRNSSSDEPVPSQELTLENLMPVDAESKWLMDSMEKGIYEALYKEYLKALKFCVFETIEGPVIEEYVFSFNYLSYNNQDVLMNVSHMVKNGQGSTLKYIPSQEIPQNQIRTSARKMIHTLIQLIGTLNKKPEEQSLLMKLLYFDDAEHMNYEPPFFGGCTSIWTKNPLKMLKMETVNVNNREFVLAFKIKSIPDPSEDENDDIQNVVILAAKDTDSETENEGKKVVAPIDDTQDAYQDQEQLGQAKEWIGPYLLDMPTELILSNVSNSRVSRESFAQVIKNSKGKDDMCDELDTFSCGESSSQNKCSKKTNTEHVVDLDPRFLSIRSWPTIKKIATEASNYLDTWGIFKWFLKQKKDTPPVVPKTETTHEAPKVSSCSWPLRKDSPFCKLITTSPAITPAPFSPKPVINFSGMDNILKRLGIPKLGFVVNTYALGQTRAEAASDGRFHYIALHNGNDNIFDVIQGAMQAQPGDYGQRFYNIVRSTGAIGWFVMIDDTVLHLVNNGNGRAVISSDINGQIFAERVHCAGYLSVQINESTKVFVLGSTQIWNSFTDTTLVQVVNFADRQDTRDHIAENIVNHTVANMEENDGAINLGGAVIFFKWVR